MLANYHTHTRRCRHAVGEDRQYAEAAVKAGLKILGFSDHSPYYFPDGYYSSFRMRPEELEGYVESVLSLRKAYAGVLEIPLGLELEYYPKYLPRLLTLLREYPMDYLLLGQHFIGNEYGDSYSGNLTGDEAVLRRYVDQTIEAMNTGLFTYFAHPDVIHFQGEPAVYRRHMRRLCREAKSCGIPLEMNLLGLQGGRHYPNPLFWETAAEEGCLAVLGRDAHDPAVLSDTATEERALEWLHDLGLKPMETVPLRKL
ncbi:MAG: histidinol-phosphatase [Firmicutes bacterium]|nr:histidinol-phosphatase [Bacillota bacterium]